MSESSAEKPFDATPSRIVKARREGNVARSNELGATLAFAAAAASAVAAAPAIASLAKAAIATAASGEAAFGAALAVAGYSLIPAAAGSVAAVAAAVLQNGGVALVPLSFKFERLNPAEGLKRMASRETLLHAVRAALAFTVASSAILPSFRDLLRLLQAQAEPTAIAATAWSAAQHVVFAAIGVGAVFAFAEYGVARRAWLQRLKMSFEELKREHKEHDGDPLARSRRKAMHRSLARGAVAKVKDAAFVVVNPTHVAVALQYQPPEIAVPIVLVRAAGEAALRVRDFAVEHRVPVVENVALARALYRDAEAGAPVPQQHYIALAEVVVALLRVGALQ